MPSGGRPKNPIWEHFTEINVGSKVIAKCRYCDIQMSNKAARMKAHL